MKLARIAQMESSRIVGERAQTQALLRAPIQTARVGLSGGNLERPLSRHGARNTGAEPIHLAVSKSSGSPASTRGNRSGHLGARNDDPLFPLLPAGSVLKSANAFDALAEVSPTLAVAQATIDFLKVLSALLLVGVTGAGIGIAVFYFLFL